MDAPPFRFDSSLTPQQNIERFVAHMETVDADRTKLLKDNIDKMLPLQDGAARTTQRANFVKDILKDLDTID